MTLEDAAAEPVEPQAPSAAPQQQQGDGDAKAAVAAAAVPEAPMSKNALKRLRRQQEWEDGKEDRRKRRRAKRHDRRERQREERAALLAQGADPAAVVPRRRLQLQQRAGATLVPVALIIDCGFEAYMSDKELVSLASQATRCYSDNRGARFKAHLWMAGWAGKIRHRFETVLGGQHRHWKGVSFVEHDFRACADEARRRMAERPGELIDALRRGRPGGGAGQEADRDNEAGGEERDAGHGAPAWTRDEPGREPLPLPDPEPELDEAYRDVVYLASESPYTLQRLEPHTSYVIGGFVDKNREKGLCYRGARQLGIRTARLPIGQFMVMQSRRVLATNHVVEIMLRWLEFGDWGRAFMAAIPKRKRGRLIGDDADDADVDVDDVDDTAVAEAEGDHGHGDEVRGDGDYGHEDEVDGDGDGPAGETEATAEGGADQPAGATS